MTKTQKKLIQTYRAVFPNDTYNIIANKSQIQKTRVFRIFNGSHMKLSEFENLNDLIKESTFTTNLDFQKISQQCSDELSLSWLNDLQLEMTYLLNLHRSFL